MERKCTKCKNKTEYKYPYSFNNYMEIYDTYVKANDGHTMHFDVITSEKNQNKAIEYAKKWLSSIGERDSTVTTEQCQFCHSQSVPEPVSQAIEKDGFFIQKMEGCP